MGKMRAARLLFYGCFYITTYAAVTIELSIAIDNLTLHIYGLIIDGALCVHICV